MSNRIDDIAREIYRATAEFNIAEAERKDLSELLDAKKDEVTSTRESVLGKIADLSFKGQWTLKEIKSATKKAITMHNDERTARTVATFISETRLAADPNVRDKFAGLLDLRDRAWEAEVQAHKADKSTPTPLRKFAGRRYHLLTRMLGEAENQNYFTTVGQVVRWAENNDPSLDAAKVHKKIQEHREKLAAFLEQFPDDDLIAAVDLLNKVTEATLVNAHATLTPKPDPRKLAAALAPKAKPVESATGAADIDFDELLGNKVSLAA
jgi:hypothetical protein